MHFLSPDRLTAPPSFSSPETSQQHRKSAMPLVYDSDEKLECKGMLLKLVNPILDAAQAQGADLTALLNGSVTW